MIDFSKKENKIQKKKKYRAGETQDCPQCGHAIGVVAGSHEAVCKNCGFKDPCCE